MFVVDCNSVGKRGLIRCGFACNSQVKHLEVGGAILAARSGLF